MLFDLRGRGRRRTIQAIYLSLAILMGGGLVFFGIGGETSGGLFDAFKGDNGGGGGSGFETQVKNAQKRTRLQPRNAAAWAELARVRYQAAGSGENFDQGKRTFTDKGRAELARAAQAWERYLALKPKKVDSNLANLMTQVYAPGALSQPDKAVAAYEIFVESEKPNSNLFAQLAVLAYQAGQTRKGDLAADKAVSLAPKDERPNLKDQLEQAKSQSLGAPQTTTTG